jgi:hypothetical protein
MPLPLPPHARRIFSWERAEAFGRSCGKGYVLDADGDQWFTKGLRRQELTSEFVGSSIASAFGLPIPDFGVAAASVPPPPAWANVPSGYTRWMSRLEPSTAPWDDALLDRITNLNDLGGVLALDAILHISDRHERNVLLVPSDGDTHRLAVIDFDGSPLGDPEVFSDLAERGSVPHPDALLVSGLLLRQPIVEGARALASSAAGQVGRFDEICEVGCRLGGRSAESETLKTALNRRLAGAPDLVERYLEAVRRRQP